MFLTITTTHQPATDLGYLLHKNPAHLRSVELAFGKAHVFFPEATAERCTAALALDVDPVALVRARHGDAIADAYVNDRPYAATSFLATALNRLFNTAMGGTSKERPELVGQPLDLEVRLPALPSQRGEATLRAFFEPLGYHVDCRALPLDDTFPQWGASRYFDVMLRARLTLLNLLNHLYVLIPALDGERHYWIGEDEIEKLLRKGEGWLASHPAREDIVHRYMSRKRSLARRALARLTPEDDPEADDPKQAAEAQEEATEKPIRLNETRMDTVTETIAASGAKRVLDLGCGEGKLLRRLVDVKSLDEIVGMDVSMEALERAQERVQRLPERLRKRVRLLHGSLTYRDQRLAGFDAATCVEVVEHLDLPRLAAFERVLFEFARPALIVLTTPNIEYNAKFPALAAGTLRNHDHRFEWTRAEFQAWAAAQATRFGYSVEFKPVGEEDPLLGPPTQMGVFTRL